MSEFNRIFLNFLHLNSLISHCTNDSSKYKFPESTIFTLDTIQKNILNNLPNILIIYKLKSDLRYFTVNSSRMIIFVEQSIFQKNLSEEELISYEILIKEKKNEKIINESKRRTLYIFFEFFHEFVHIKRGLEEKDSPTAFIDFLKKELLYLNQKKLDKFMK